MWWPSASPAASARARAPRCGSSPSGALTLSADEVVHQLYARPDVKQALAGISGRRCWTPRARSTGGGWPRWCGAGGSELAWLETLTHPLVGEEIERFIARGAGRRRWWSARCPCCSRRAWQRLFDLVVTVEAGAEARRSAPSTRSASSMFGEFEASAGLQRAARGGSDLAFFNDGDVGAPARVRARGVRTRPCAAGAGRERRRSGVAGAAARRTARRRRRRLLRLAIVVVVAGAWSSLVAVVSSPGGWWCPASRARSIPSSTRARSRRVAEKYDVDPYLLAAVARTESGFDPQAESRRGRRGPHAAPARHGRVGHHARQLEGAEEPRPDRPCRTAWSWAPAIWPTCSTRFDATARRRSPPTTPARARSPTGSKAGGADSFGAADIPFPETGSSCGG